jgi:predicted nucleic acid-binding protein
MSAFIDTNIFVYAISVAPEDAPKRRVALGLLAGEEIHLSLQVVQEFIHVCLRKKRLGLEVGALERAVRQMLAFPCHVPAAASVLRALELHRSHQISYWDAAIIAAAQDLGCHTLYSEDLNHGQEFAGVRVLNPFMEKGNP